jgi:tripartite-type tricarboxylate transporter receptor subunit TctC
MRAMKMAAVFLAILVASANVAQAQPFPTRPLKIVVPFSPGGIGDTMARILAEEIAKGLQQPVVVDNRPGAGAVIAYEFVARSAADGYTALLVFPSFVINPSARRVSYDPLKDFKAVGQAVSVPLAIAVNPGVPAKSLEQLVLLARAKPGEMTYGTPGVGTTHHVFAEMFKVAASVDMTHVPYPGGAPAMAAAIGGHIPILVSNVTEFVSQSSSGKIRVLAVTGPNRVDGLSDVPTLRELGYSELETTNWAGMVVPAATPTAIIARWNAELGRALRNAEVQAKLNAHRMTPVPGTSEQFADLLRSESVRYSKTIKEAGIKLD